MNNRPGYYGNTFMGYYKSDTNSARVRVVVDRNAAIAFLRKYFYDLPDAFYLWLRFSKQGETYTLVAQVNNYVSQHWIMAAE